MGELSRPDQEEKEPQEEQLPAQSWDQVFLRAADPPEGGSRDAAPRLPSGPAAPWLKAALPFAIVLIYAIVKLVDSPRPATSAVWDVRQTPETLSGVKPEQEPIQIERAMRDRLAVLEDLYRRNAWQQLRAEVDNEPDPKIREHALIRAMGLLARARAGERNTELERALENAEISIRTAGTRHAGLLEELRLARVEQILSRSNTRENFAYNIDLIYRLIGPDAATDRAVQVRGKVANTFENFADELLLEGDRIMGRDILKIREARLYYQSALRFVVKSNRWMELDPISARTSADVERLVQKIREANRKVHGPSLPFTAADSYTWTGRRGDPVHDEPRR